MPAVEGAMSPSQGGRLCFAGTRGFQFLCLISHNQNAAVVRIVRTCARVSFCFAKLNGGGKCRRPLASASPKQAPRALKRQKKIPCFSTGGEENEYNNLDIIQVQSALHMYTGENDEYIITIRLLPKKVTKSISRVLSLGEHLSGLIVADKL